MYAWVVRRERYGEPLAAYQLEVLAVPEPADDEVLVYVMAAGINYNGIWAAAGSLDASETFTRLALCQL
jgi:crotonyl-CoA carboxylase/reductase